MGIAFIGLGRFDEAVAAAKNALRKMQTHGTAYLCLAAALAHLGLVARFNQFEGREFCDLLWSHRMRRRQ